ncbi:transmembrane protein 94-like [Chiloscyllium plagiosum]|uniref:transmembrane protein 94-like n=1 Tax=Chiloscyllium plagiosum TaxID=36176 RepID=UPI001CB82B3B|nr:transmembrane protein 94-like [Chiloscyllium plagiosum]
MLATSDRKCTEFYVERCEIKHFGFGEEELEYVLNTYCFKIISLAANCLEYLEVMKGAIEIKGLLCQDIRLINESALFIFLVVNLSAIGLQQWLKSQEIPQRVQAILQRINVLIRTPEFGMNDFCYELYNPSLDSICLQWTYRDGQLVNLPTNLLVEGDIIALRPGQKAPTSLRGIEDEEHVILDRDDIFCQFSSPPSPVQNKRSHTHSLLKPHPFKVTKTPMVENIQRCLELGQQRPVTVLNNERFTAQRLLQKYIAPMVLVVLLIINGLRFVIGTPGIGSWQVTLLQLQVNSVLPLLPLSFPIIWFLVNIYGEAQMVALLLKPTANFKENWIETWRMFWATIRGRAPALCQTSSLLHNLGSITVLCCVDKQGILSWPSSCPDKVFFFTDAWRRAKPQDKNLTASISVKTAPSTHCTVQRGNEHPELLSNAVMADHQTNFAIEMLSLSQDQQDATHIWFDDSSWQEHSPSLRPLGLSILLGLCDSTSAARVFQMTDHLSHIALKKSRWSCLPVQISGGLCELPRIIGFTSSARNLFHKQTYTAAYTSTAMTNTQEASPWEPSFITKRKLPLSHMINLLVHTSNSEEMQLFSYGSADTILDACSEFWDGNDICPLSQYSRKKIFDFYQRACLTGECIALSYKPVFHTLQSSDDETCPQVSLKTKSYSQADTSAALDLEELTFDQEDNLHPLDNQILLGLISSQYQARLDMVHLIDGLDNTCIRFVYFSLENELKSKSKVEKRISSKSEVNHEHAVRNSSYVSPNWFDEYGNALMLAQKIVAFFILLHGLCTSMSHVHRSNPLWKQSPLSNRWWCAAVIIAFLLHMIQINVAYHMWDNKSSHLVFHILDIPTATWLLGFLWLFPLMVINEFLKLHEIRMRVHYQKKQKLQFDTKLGMNSPF